jgi:hypothetical protein
MDLQIRQARKEIKSIVVNSSTDEKRIIKLIENLLQLTDNNPVLTKPLLQKIIRYYVKINRHLAIIYIRVHLKMLNSNIQTEEVTPHP